MKLPNHTKCPKCNLLTLPSEYDNTYTTESQIACQNPKCRAIVNPISMTTIGYYDTQGRIFYSETPIGKEYIMSHPADSTKNYDMKLHTVGFRILSLTNADTAKQLKSGDILPDRISIILERV